MKYRNGLKKEQKRPKYYSAKRRAEMAAGEVIDPVEIFKRDNWICRICNELIERHRRCPDPLAATLDHIIPLSKYRAVTGLEQSGHRKDNVQAAHKRCNELRGDGYEPITALAE
jgi:hypothetical protein